MTEYDNRHLGRNTVQIWIIVIQILYLMVIKKKNGKI